MTSSSRSSGGGRDRLPGLDHSGRAPLFMKRYSIDEGSADHRPLLGLTGAPTYTSMRRRSKKSPSLPDGSLIPQRRASTKSLGSNTSDGEKKDRRVKLKTRQSKLRVRVLFRACQSLCMRSIPTEYWPSGD